jgi:predicted HicB family RNase H-like nuclease
VNTYPRISFRLSPDLNKRLRAKAEREGISLSQLIKKIIEHNARSLS